MATLERAILLAVQAHQGQKDKNGEPYILHPIRVMCRVDTETEKIIAILHDVVEDTPITLKDLEEAGYPPEVISGVDALSRRADETYGQFIERVNLNPIARRIKLADLEDNMDIRRLANLNNRDLERLHRYQQAWQILTEAEKVQGDTSSWLI